MVRDKLKVAAYCRVSTDKADQANSLEGQLRYFTAYIGAQEGWELTQVYYDEGVTGTSVKKRTGFNRMMQDAYGGAMDLLLTKEVSRFARNTVDALTYTRELKRLGVGVLFTLDNINTLDNDGELRLSIMASIAQEESRKTSERVKWGQKRRMEQGVVFGRDLLGYFVKEGKLIPNPAEVEVVRLIFHKFVHEGKGAHVIARELQAAGIAPKRGREWHSTVILRILRNEKYVGDLCQKKTYTPDYLTHSKQYNRGQEEQVYLVDHHPPIIDREMWGRAQQELERRAPLPEQRARHSNRYWCSGRVVCGACGGRFVSRTKKRRDGGVYKAWRCYGAAVYGRTAVDGAGNRLGCDSASVNDKVLLACMGYLYRHMEVDRTALKEEILRELEGLQAAPAQEALQYHSKALAALEEKKRKAIDLALDGLISREDLRRQQLYYEERIAKLAEAAGSSGAIHQSQEDWLAQCGAEAEKILYWEEGGEEVYKALLDHIEIHSNCQIVVYLKCIPFGVRLQYQTAGRMEAYHVKITQAGPVA